MPNGRPAQKRHVVTQPLNQSYRFIPLTQGQTAIVDAEDFKWLSQWNWCAWRPTPTQTFYAVRAIGRKILYMHRILLRAKEVDHRNGNGIDNRRTNLRPCTRSQNQHNRKKNTNSTSGFKGVCLHESKQKWSAHIQVNHKSKHLGYFQSAEQAARRYDEAAKKLHEEFARLNFPEA